MCGRRRGRRPLRRAAHVSRDTVQRSLASLRRRRLLVLRLEQAERGGRARGRVWGFDLDRWAALICETATGAHGFPLREPDAAVINHRAFGHGVPVDQQVWFALDRKHRQSPVEIARRIGIAESTPAAFEQVYSEADDDLRSDLYVYFAMTLAQLAADSRHGLERCAEKMGEQVRKDMLESREFTSEA